MRLLLLSNSVAPGQAFLEHALESISDAMGEGRRLLFFFRHRVSSSDERHRLMTQGV